MRKLLFLSLFFLLAGCGGKNADVAAPGSDLDEPDKALYDRAMNDLERSRFTITRLALNTLINT